MKKVLIISIIICIGVLFGIAFAEEDRTDPNFHSPRIDESTSWDETGCTLNVQDKTTNKWASAIFHRLWPDTVTWENSVSIGDTLYIDAHTIYNGGKLWVYENGVVTHEEDAGNHEHIYYEFVVTTENIKIACSASTYARRGEELIINIKAKGDKNAPTVTVNKYSVAKGTAANISLVDDIGVTGYYISQRPDTPTGSQSGWTAITANTNYTYNEIQNRNPGNYYIWAKDAAGNVSNRAEYEVGLVPITDETDQITKPYEILEFENAIFNARLKEGTTPITYQWYESTSDSYSGTAISGQTTDQLTLTNVARNKNNHYYYCEITNRFGTYKSPIRKLTVLYAHKFSVSPTSVSYKYGDNINNLKLTASETEQGNTNRYTYQWYKSAYADGGTSNLIQGATNSTYTVDNTKDSDFYYYCVVKNYRLDGTTVAYTYTTNRSHVIVDVKFPEVTIGSISFKADKPTPKERGINGDQYKFINKTYTVNVPFTIKDNSAGQEFREDGSNFVANDVVVLVNGTEVTCDKQMTYNVRSSHQVDYVFTVTNIPSNGSLSFKISANSFEDNLHNKNLETSFTTDIMLDNTPPVLTQYTYIDSESAANGKYLNKDKTIVVQLSIDDNYGFDKSIFTDDDITILVNNTEASEVATKELLRITNSLNTDKKQLYELKLRYLEGDGVLAIKLNTDKIEDWATTGNVETVINLKNLDNEELIVDNTAPTFLATGIVARLDAYDSTKEYPTSLDSWHENWSNKSIYITLNATDTGGYPIDYYTTSTKSHDTTITKMPEGSSTPKNREVLSDEFKGYRFYRAYDMAGNFTEQSIEIKIDKTAPNVSKFYYYELKEGGVRYYPSESSPSNRNIIMKPSSSTDTGTVQSGIYFGDVVDPTHAYDEMADYNTSENKCYPSYYKVTMYSDINRSAQVGSPSIYHMKELSKLYEDDGYYVVEAVTTDIAGNYTTQEEFFYIQKTAFNTLRLTNISDIGSGVRRFTINVYKPLVPGSNEPDTSSKVIPTITVNNPGKSYETSLRLGKGTFIVVVTLWDNALNPDGSSMTGEEPSGNKTVLNYYKVTNNF